MAVPANPKLTQVIAEFEAPANARLSQFLRGGAYVLDTPANAAVPTALPIRLSQLAGAVKGPPPAVVNIVGAELSAFGAAALGTYCRYYLTNTALEQSKEGSAGIVTIGTWVISGTAANYDAMATVLSDDGGAILGGAATGAWLNLGTSREWNYGNGGVGATGQCVLRIDIRNASTGVILDSANVSMLSERV